MAGGAGWRLAITIYFTAREERRKLAARTKMNHLPLYAGTSTGAEKNSRDRKSNPVKEDCAARGKEGCLLNIKILRSSKTEGEDLRVSPTHEACRPIRRIQKRPRRKIDA